MYLLIEFLDELVFGVGESAWPLLRNDLHLTYTQIGLLVSLPGIIAAFIEPFLGILGDVWKRRALILGGGIFFTLSLLLTSISPSFIFLLSSFIFFYPSSGAFVSLSQASLMDSATDRHEQNMARWTFAGSLGNVLGPIFVYATVLISVSIVISAGLSFIGLGASPPSAEWGLMLNTLRESIFLAPLVSVLPGFMIFIASMCFNLISDGLRSAMDVRL